MKPLDIGDVIVRLRNTRGMTQRAFAKKLGVTNVHLCNVENGKNKASLDLIDRVEKLTGINPYVFAWNEQRKGGRA